MEFTHVNPQRKYRPVGSVLAKPTAHIHVGASVEPSIGRTPLPGRSRAKAALLEYLKARGKELERLAAVHRVTVYRAVLVPPPTDTSTVQPARMPHDDVAVLIDVRDTDAIGEVQASDSYRDMLQALAESARSMHVMPAHCGRSLGRVDRSRGGLFVFQYWVAEDASVAARVWEHVTGWYAVETRLDNSDLLAPLAITESDYTFVNHARTDSSLPVFFVREFAKRSFRRYVVANLRANRTTFMTVVYRLA